MKSLCRVQFGLGQVVSAIVLTLIVGSLYTWVFFPRVETRNVSVAGVTSTVRIAEYRTVTRILGAEYVPITIVAVSPEKEGRIWTQLTLRVTDSNGNTTRILIHGHPEMIYRPVPWPYQSFICFSVLSEIIYLQYGETYTLTLEGTSWTRRIHVMHSEIIWIYL